jgi:hypothetical protein
MVARPSLLLVLAGALSSLGAAYRTQNFVVTVDASPQVAQQIGQYAEHYRKEKAILWLGQEMPPWGQPCPLKVTISMNGSGGATSFGFDNGRILSMDMHIEGTLDRLLASVLPHEVTHTVFAHAFRRPLPRWADEGGSVLSEDEQERNRHDQLVRQILNTPGRAIPLRRLFKLMEYPRDVMVLYAEGYSVCNFLVSSSSRSVFLAFIGQGMGGDWDGAVRQHYHYNSVEELEQAWLQFLRTGHQAPAQLASRTSTEGAGPQQVVVRNTVPPAQPWSNAPQTTFRGQAPTGPEDGPYGTPPSSNQFPQFPGQPPSNQFQQFQAQPMMQDTAGPFIPPPTPGSAWQVEGQPLVANPPVWLQSPQVESPPVQLVSPIIGAGPR